MSAICDSFKDDLSAYLDGELDNARQTEVIEHLGICAGCSDECSSLKSMSALLAKGQESVGMDFSSLWQGIQSKMPTICEVIQEDLSAYLDGELIAPSKEGVADHLKTCPPCHEDFQNLSSVNGLISQGLKIPEQMQVDIWSGLAARLNEDCGIIGEELSSFYDREVTADRHRAVTSHLLDCADCRDHLQSISSNGDLLRAHYQPNLPEDFDLWPSIRAKIAVVPFAPRDKKKKTLAARRLYAVAAVVAAGVLAAVAGFVNFTHPSVAIAPVPAETYLIESALGEPADLAESVVYEN